MDATHKMRDWKCIRVECEFDIDLYILTLILKKDSCFPLKKKKNVTADWEGHNHNHFMSPKIIINNIHNKINKQ